MPQAKENAVGDHYSVFELLDLRSFANLWYWLMLPVVWSIASYFMLGVPYDLFRRAKYYGGEDAEDMKTIVRLYTKRTNALVSQFGATLIAFTFFILTLLGGLGFVYQNEFSQALFLILAPASLIAALNVYNSQRIWAARLYEDTAALIRIMGRYRLTVQLMGIVMVAVTSFWGIYVNVVRSALSS